MSVSLLILFFVVFCSAKNGGTKGGGTLVMAVLFPLEGLFCAGKMAINGVAALPTSMGTVGGGGTSWAVLVGNRGVFCVVVGSTSRLLLPKLGTVNGKEAASIKAKISGAIVVELSEKRDKMRWGVLTTPIVSNPSVAVSVSVNDPSAC